MSKKEKDQKDPLSMRIDYIVNFYAKVELRGALRAAIIKLLKDQNGGKISETKKD